MRRASIALRILFAKIAPAGHNLSKPEKTTRSPNIRSPKLLIQKSRMWYSACHSLLQESPANMLWMDCWRRKQGHWIWPTAILLAASVACSRQLDLPTEEATPQTDQAPFRDVSSTSHNETSAHLVDLAQKPAGIPFRDSQHLPSGSLLNIRLKSPISAADNSTFEGMIEDPVVVQGKTVIPQGSVVSGRVESASPLTVQPDRGYVRLTLTSVRIGEVDVPIQTASLFARQHNPGNPSNRKVRLDKGHLLTFRLTEPVYATTQSAKNLQ